VTLLGLVKLLHVARAMWLVSGVLGRAVALSAARRATDMRILKAIADASGRLENLMIAPGIFAVVATGIAAALDTVTERLRPFLAGRAMLRRYAPDVAFVRIIVVLMVLKPF
jgi:hypothetical protein